jgi:hypothetical protein
MEAMIGMELGNDGRVAALQRMQERYYNEPSLSTKRQERAFKIRRYLDGCAGNYKARNCVRGTNRLSLLE